MKECIFGASLGFLLAWFLSSNITIPTAREIAQDRKVRCVDYCRDNYQTPLIGITNQGVCFCKSEGENSK